MIKRRCSGFVVSQLAQQKRIHSQCKRHRRCGFGPGLGRSLEEPGNPLWHSWKSHGRGVCGATVRGVAREQSETEVTEHAYVVAVLAAWPH